MQFFIDTGDINEITEAATWGVVDGVTTNPSLIASTGRKQSDVIKEIAEVIDGVGYKRRKERLDDLFKDEDKKKRFIHLICRIKGEKVYDDKVEVKDVDVKVEDAELVVETIVKKVKLEIKENV